VTAPDAPHATPNPWWLAIRVIDEPGQVFRHLAAKPRALVPILLMVITSILAGAAMPDSALQRLAEQQADAVAERTDDFTEEDRAAMLENAVSTQRRVIIAVSATVFSLAWFAIVAGVLLLIMGAVGSEPLKYKDEFAIVTHAFVPSMIGGVVVLLIMRFTGLEEVQLSLGFLFDPESSPFLHGVAAGISLFGAWTVFLLALGNQIRTRTKTLNSPLMVIGGLWIVLLLIRGGLTSVFGSFG
jgi:hypothetical protein